ncbi:glucosyl-3-phosphoglycerate synthase [Actinomycetospora cinnamomea]|uniref:Glucosyl-3-phosphoglycerate synthase n=1 Tax=Actinomycetospora cinnamomea TaxID=663609 RepID=A0A2U1FA88_9PSEU|nr:glucosyl-3-phosphoglycerate synthase [Actinomycetospora cinnamomea]PVZ09107.1 glucosyl-3-phosphoglycerate synthase [Actinomycetospora cinnamomea]
MLPEVRRWLSHRTSRTEDWPVDRMAAQKGGRRVTVVLPARDEAATIGRIVTVVREALVERTGLVDEILVVDSRSRDATAEVAAAAGATVVDQDAVLADVPPAHGKGEALWKGLAASTGDLVAAVDADLYDVAPAFVTGLLGPLLDDPDLAFVKGFYHRPLVGDGTVDVDGGGRVSELVARSLLNLAWPRLAGFVQPLAGEFAACRDLLEAIPFATGYGVELAMLVDVLEHAGLDAMAQVDLGVRVHRHHDLQTLGRMSAQIQLAASARLARQGVLTRVPTATTIVQYRRPSVPGPGGLDREVVVTDVAVDERPPLREVLDRSRPVA